MPIRVKKTDGYRVSTPGGVKAKKTTARKAMAQKRLLLAVEHGWKPTGKKQSVQSEKATKTMVMKMRAGGKKKRKKA